MDTADAGQSGSTHHDQDARPVPARTGTVPPGRHAPAGGPGPDTDRRMRGPAWACAALTVALLILIATVPPAAERNLVQLVVITAMCVIVAPLALAVLTEHPRRVLIGWLCAGALAGLVPLVVPAWWVTMSGTRARLHLPWMRARGRDADRQAAIDAIVAAALADESALHRDLRLVVLPCVADAAARCALAATEARFSVPAWLGPVQSDLETALIVLRESMRGDDEMTPPPRAP